eukprot:5858824-Amphidinium_carterae.1
MLELLSQQQQKMMQGVALQQTPRNITFCSPPRKVQSRSKNALVEGFCAWELLWLLCCKAAYSAARIGLRWHSRWASWAQKYFGESPTCMKVSPCLQQRAYWL